MKVFAPILFATLSLASGALQAAGASGPMSPYVAVYSVSWGGTSLGDGTITLAAQPEKDCYRFESRTQPVAPVRWFYGAPRETSVFCMENGVITPRHFEYHNDKREKDNFSLDFDAQGRRVKLLKGGELSQRELPAPGYDRFLVQQVVRLWVASHAGQAEPEPLDLVMVEDDRTAAYRFAITGRETVEVPAGRFETVRVERIDNPRKTMRSWLVPERDYLPAKIERIEDGKVKLRMLLK